MNEIHSPSHPSFLTFFVSNDELQTFKRAYYVLPLISLLMDQYLNDEDMHTYSMSGIIYIYHCMYICCTFWNGPLFYCRDPSLKSYEDNGEKLFYTRRTTTIFP